MTRKIGIFHTQQQAISAIEQLEQAGFVTGELQVLAKDSEHSRRIEAESDIHVDELRELMDASDGSSGLIAAASFEGAGMTSPNGVVPLIGGTNPLINAAYAGESRGSDILQSFGLDSKEAQQCYQALQNGSIVVIAETDESKSLFDKDGGPDLSRLGAVEAIYRGCGAESIISGA
ncbi:Heat induced stress protein YflT [compost metagenome]